MRIGIYLLFLLTACGGGVIPSAPTPSESGETEAHEEAPDLIRLVVRPSYLALTKSGDSRQLQVELILPAKTPPPSESIQFSSEDEAVATVDENGLVTAVAAGETRIEASQGDRTAQVYLVVRTEEETPPDNSEPSTPDLPPPLPPIRCDPLPPSADPYADEVVSYQIGEQGGFHEERLPEIVLGPPRGVGNRSGGVDVFSLGLGGEIILEFTDFLPCNGEGADLIVFENSFYSFFEPAAISVSEDGENWVEFPCLRTLPLTGCAGNEAVFANPFRNQIDPTDPAVAGGHPYDLGEIWLPQVRFVKITDINGCLYLHDQAHCSGAEVGGILGFDLDAVVVVNGISP